MMWLTIEIPFDKLSINGSIGNYKYDPCNPNAITSVTTKANNYSRSHATPCNEV